MRGFEISFTTILHAAVVTAICYAVPMASPVSAEEIDCRMCHADLTAKKVKHAAVEMGCPGCHSAVNATDVPHKMSTKVTRGLASEQPELCFGCHDKSPFGKKNVHAAVVMGCTGCHNPHSTDKPSLLTANVPDLCFSCHNNAEFGRKNVHPPVLAGQCLTCHTPHSSDQPSLLKKEPVMLCLDCHGAVEKRPHAIKGFGNAGHPVGKREKKDPKRPDRLFTCGSCHNPHSSDSIRLFRYPAGSTMALCRNCHTY